MGLLYASQDFMSLLTDVADVAIGQDLKQFLIILLVALSAASLPKVFPVFRQVPYTLLLLIVGLSLALVELLARREALYQVEQYLLQSQSQLYIHPKLAQAYLAFIADQLQKLQQDLALLQEKHPQLQSFSNHQNQEKLLDLETQVYSRYRQAGLLKTLPTSILKSIQSIP